MTPISLTVNGAPVEVEAWEGESLLYVLRERLGLWGAKNACEQGECGSCSVLLDGALVCSCLVLAAFAEGAAVVTVEGLGGEEAGRLVQRKLAEAGGVQCGFCTPGFVVAIASLVRSGRRLSPEELREELSGNLCRCTGYVRILEAAEAALAAVADGQPAEGQPAGARPA